MFLSALKGNFFMVDERKIFHLHIYHYKSKAKSRIGKTATILKKANNLTNNIQFSTKTIVINF